ncbi:hypothetical protein JOB18_048072 [Solea senegalensis]|uniref:Uncharacterized protein n=1 Tax=Solea senegalensis TaxID=28829 RepID=A0AAV6RSY3_SOLSE|nr:hypothetical protein JOB18_048072 [Solea senegalensis]
MLLILPPGEEDPPSTSRPSKLSQTLAGLSRTDTDTMGMDLGGLFLHKWELLERHPVLLLAKRTTGGFVAECFCLWQIDTEDAKDALATIKRIYEMTVATRAEETPAQSSEVPTTSRSSAPPVSTPCSPPVSTPCSPPVSYPCSPPVSTPCSPPVSTPSSSQQKKKEGIQTLVGAVHQGSSVFPYKKLLKQRVREGCVEVLVQWQPCSGCGANGKTPGRPKTTFKLDQFV